MTAEGRGWVRASTALDSDYEAESRLLGDLEKTDEATRGKLLRALVERRAPLRELERANPKPSFTQGSEEQRSGLYALDRPATISLSINTQVLRQP